MRARTSCAETCVFLTLGLVKTPGEGEGAYVLLLSAKGTRSLRVWEARFAGSPEKRSEVEEKKSEKSGRAVK